MNFTPLAASVLATMMAVAAVAQPATLTTTVMKQTLSRDAAGHVVTSLAPTVRAAPGDQLVYVVTYKNSADKPATGIVVTNAVPAEVEYLGAGDGPAPLVSLDSRSFVKADASTPVGEVAAVQWIIPEAIPAGGEARMSFRAKVR